MVSFKPGKRCSPIGVDIGTRSIKLMQFSADHGSIVEFVRWELPNSTEGDVYAAMPDALQQMREGRNFRGRDAVLCLNASQLFVQNVRIPKAPTEQTQELVEREVEGRLPFPLDESDVRFIDAADVRQGETIKRETIVLACHRPVLDRLLEATVAGGLRPVAVDAEPLAILRAYCRQFRRDEDQEQRALYVHLGWANTAVMVAQGEDVLFVKYLDLGGQQMDEAVARHLEIPLADAAGLRRHNGDRRAEQQDPEIARSVATATRPVIDRLSNELSMCVRYHSVTFRGKPLARVLISGGEATPQLVETLTRRLDLKCELGDPLRSYERGPSAHHRGQWDVATGLALREIVETA